MLKFIATPPPSAELAGLAALTDLEEVLLEHELLARNGTLDENQLLARLAEARQLGLRAVLVWDVLASDQILHEGAALLARLVPHGLAAIRAQDPGVADYVRQTYSEIPLHLVLETGNHNLTGLQTWLETLQPQRMVLSNELPAATLRRLASALHCELEIAGLGRLLIFYSPRALVQAADVFDQLSTRYAIEEDTRRHFPIIENRHGTFMYYEKDLNLLGSLDEVAASGVAFVRLDFKFFNETLLTKVAAWFQQRDAQGLEAIAAELSPRSTRGFFKSNRTDKQFSRLKNTHLRVREDQPLLAIVLESSKKQGYTLLQTEGKLHRGMRFLYQIPEGESLTHELEWIRQIDGTKLEQTEQPGLYLINHARRASPGTKCYSCD